MTMTMLNVHKILMTEQPIGNHVNNILGKAHQGYIAFTSQPQKVLVFS